MGENTSRKSYYEVEGMKTNQGAIILAERAADHARIRAVLREWGYREREIQRLLKEPRVDQNRSRVPTPRRRFSGFTGFDWPMALLSNSPMAW